MPGHSTCVSVAVESKETGAPLTRDKHECPTRQSIRLAMLADDLSVGLQSRSNHASLCRNRDLMQIRSTKTNVIRTTQIAPCGMNCRLCRAYIRDKKACPTCRSDDSLKSKACVTCRIKNCEKIAKGKINYCFGCDRFPCDRLNHLDERYRTKYGMSMIDNLLRIKKFGIRHFDRNETERWTCPECSQLICVHKPQCLSCGHKWR
jgi:hypothetical protein